MRCANCQGELRPDAAFCGSCGSVVQQQPDDAAAPQIQAPPPVVPPAPVVAQPAQPAYDPSAYAQQPAQPAYDPSAYAQQPGYQQPVAPAKKSKAGCIIAVVVAILLMLVACGIGGVFAFRWLASEGLITTGGSISGPGLAEGPAGEGSFATPEEAVEASLAAEDAAGWIYTRYEESDTTVVFWVGPPESEYTASVTVERNSDGTWSVTAVDSLDTGGDVAAADEAAWVVESYLQAVFEDRGGDAQGFTVEPFANDPASAQVSAGGLASYEIAGVTEQSDATFWVTTSEVWYGAPQSWEYWVVPTEVGYRIADVRAP